MESIKSNFNILVHAIQSFQIAHNIPSKPAYSTLEIAAYLETTRWNLTQTDTENEYRKFNIPS